MLWGWAGKPVEDAAPEETRVREALRGDLGKPLCGHLTGQRWTGSHARAVALLDNPVMPTPTGSGRSRGPRF